MLLASVRQRTENIYRKSYACFSLTLEAINHELLKTCFHCGCTSICAGRL